MVVCTGRPQPYAEAIIQIIDAFYPIPSIVENGLFLYYPDKDIIIPHPNLKKSSELMKEVEKIVEQEFIETEKAKKEPGKEICVSLNPFWMSVTDLLAMVEETLPSDIKEKLFITHSASAVDITPEGINKSSGLDFFSQQTEISFENMLGIGDSQGDLPVLEKVGLPACPADSQASVIELVKKRNGYVAKAPNTKGVWEIIEKHCLV